MSEKRQKSQTVIERENKRMKAKQINKTQLKTNERERVSSETEKEGKMKEIRQIQHLLVSSPLPKHKNRHLSTVNRRLETGINATVMLGTREDRTMKKTGGRRRDLQERTREVRDLQTHVITAQQEQGTDSSGKQK